MKSQRPLVVGPDLCLGPDIGPGVCFGPEVGPDVFLGPEVGPDVCLGPDVRPDVCFVVGPDVELSLIITTCTEINTRVSKNNATFQASKIETGNNRSEVSEQRITARYPKCGTGDD